jgi:predicted Ser/Thr protein kinase
VVARIRKQREGEVFKVRTADGQTMRLQGSPTVVGGGAGEPAPEAESWDPASPTPDRSLVPRLDRWPIYTPAAPPNAAGRSFHEKQGKLSKRRKSVEAAAWQMHSTRLGESYYVGPDKKAVRGSPPQAAVSASDVVSVLPFAPTYSFVLTNSQGYGLQSENEILLAIPTEMLDQNEAGAFLPSKKVRDLLSGWCDANVVQSVKKKVPSIIAMHYQSVAAAIERANQKLAEIQAPEIKIHDWVPNPQDVHSFEIKEAIGQKCAELNLQPGHVKLISSTRQQLEYDRKRIAGQLRETAISLARETAISQEEDAVLGGLHDSVLNVVEKLCGLAAKMNSPETADYQTKLYDLAVRYMGDIVNKFVLTKMESARLGQLIQSCVAVNVDKAVPEPEDGAEAHCCLCQLSIEELFHANKTNIWEPETNYQRSQIIGKLEMRLELFIVFISIKQRQVGSWYGVARVESVGDSKKTGKFRLVWETQMKFESKRQHVQKNKPSKKADESANEFRSRKGAWEQDPSNYKVTYTTKSIRHSEVDLARYLPDKIHHFLWLAWSEQGASILRWLKRMLPAVQIQPAKPKLQDPDRRSRTPTPLMERSSSLVRSGSFQRIMSRNSSFSDGEEFALQHCSARVNLNLDDLGVKYTCSRDFESEEFESTLEKKWADRLRLGTHRARSESLQQNRPRLWCGGFGRTSRDSRPKDPAYVGSTWLTGSTCWVSMPVVVFATKRSNCTKAVFDDLLDESLDLRRRCDHQIGQVSPQHFVVDGETWFDPPALCGYDPETGLNKLKLQKLFVAARANFDVPRAFGMPLESAVTVVRATLANPKIPSRLKVIFRVAASSLDLAKWAMSQIENTMMPSEYVERVPKLCGIGKVILFVSKIGPQDRIEQVKKKLMASFEKTVSYDEVNLHPLITHGCNADRYEQIREAKCTLKDALGLNLKFPQLYFDGKRLTNMDDEEDFLSRTDLDIWSKYFKMDGMIKLADLTIDRSRTGELGAGTTGKVYKARWKMGGNVAVKEWNETESEKDFFAELKFLQRCHHEYIVRFYGAVYMPDQDKPYMALVMEQCLGTISSVKKYGLVHDLDRPGRFSRGTHKRTLIPDFQTACSFWRRINWALGVASGLTFLHDSLNVVHKDLKSDNVLVDAALKVKICDFAFAKLKMVSQNSRPQHGPIGTPGYVAPEIWCPDPQARYSYERPADVYALGMVLWELITCVRATLWPPGALERLLRAAAPRSSQRPLPAVNEASPPLVHPEPRYLLCFKVRRCSGRRSLSLRGDPTGRRRARLPRV